MSPRPWVGVLALVAGCGRIGFDANEGGASALAITSINPPWAMPAGGPVAVTLTGDTEDVVVMIDGVPCAPTPTATSCTAPAHAPGVVAVTATNAAGESAVLAMGFAYVTPGIYQHGGAADDRSSGVAVDGAGNVYVSGGTTGDLDGPNAGDLDAIVIKYDPSGTLEWVRQLRSPLYDYARDLAVDAAGNVTIVGYTAGTLGASSAGGNDVFVAQYSSTGVLRWVQQIGSAGDDQAWDAAVDASGSIVVSARTDGAFAGNVNAGDYDYALLRLSSTGVLEWVKQGGTSVRDYGHGVAVAPDGTAFLVGYTAGLLDGPGNAGGDDMIVARFETDGTRTWIRQRGSTGDDLATDATVDANGDLWITGYTNAALDGNAYLGAADVFVMRYGATGTWAFTRQYGSAANETVFGVSAAGGAIYLACTTSGSFHGQTNAGSNDFCVISLEPDGNHRWTRIVGGAGGDASSSCALDVGNTGMLFLSLITNGSLDGRPNRGLDDVAIAKVDATGLLR